jgi:NAD(P)H-flavin reductase
LETHVYANDNEICSKAADGRSVAGPDPCWSPPPPNPGPVLIPYVNTAFAKDLEDGSSTVFICGQPLALRDVSYLANSTGNEPATAAFQKGDSSHVIKGKAYFTTWSPDVKVEGLGVCRHDDSMTHNHG